MDDLKRERLDYSDPIAIICIMGLYKWRWGTRTHTCVVAQGVTGHCDEIVTFYIVSYWEIFSDTPSVDIQISGCKIATYR